MGAIVLASAGVPAAGGADDSATAAIGFYQRYISSLRHGRCRLVPSCSQYAAEAFGAYGLLAGSARAADRLIRCNAGAAEFHERQPDGRLADPARGVSPGRVAITVPAWLLPPELAVRQAAADSLRARAPGGSRGDANSRAPVVTAFAEALAAEGDGERAATEFLRSAHLEGTTGAQTRARRRIGDTWYLAGGWSKAEAAFLAAAMVAEGDDPFRSDLVLAACCRFNAGDAPTGERLLADLVAPTAGIAGGAAGLDPTAVSPRLLGLLGLFAMRQGAWDDAQDRLAAGALAAGGPLPGARAPVERQQAAWARSGADRAARSPAASESAFADPRLAWRLAGLSAAAGEGANLPRRNARLASTLAAVLPGSGHVYAGRSQDGLRHTLVNGALIWTLASLARDRRYPATLLAAGFALPFYFGNVYGAGNAARAFNRERRIEHIETALANVEAPGSGRASR